MSTWQVVATDYDENRTEWFSEQVEAASIDAAYREAEKIADSRDQGSRFRGCDFLWRVTATLLPSGEKTRTYDANHPDLNVGWDCAHGPSQRRTALA